MQAAEAQRAVAAAMATASALDLAVDGAVVLNDSNRLVVRLTPCGPPSNLCTECSRRPSARWRSSISMPG
jgi:hypothetical protein